MERIAIQFGVDGNGLDTEFTGGADHSDSDLTTIGDQDLFEHG